MGKIIECVLFIRDAAPLDRLCRIMVTNGCVNYGWRLGKEWPNGENQGGDWWESVWYDYSVGNCP